MKIDAHQHFWNYSPSRDVWIDESMAAIQKNFLPEDLKPILQANGIDGCIAIQADQSEKETRFLLDLAENNDFIKGVVGWVDLKAENIADRLSHFSESSLFKGVRHILQVESKEAISDSNFLAGIACLQKFDLCYDLLIHHAQLPAVNKLVRRFPNQAFVLDHLGKPNIKSQKIDSWAKDIKELARSENVYCKVSGMVTEADWGNWKNEDFTPYLDVVFEAFGVGRIMFGSDWPVCLLTGSYDEVIEVILEYTCGLSKNEQNQIFGRNAVDFYKLTK